MWERATHDLVTHRGGAVQLLEQSGGLDSHALLERLIAEGAVVLARREGALVGFAVVRARVIEGLFVERALRRTGVARSLVTQLMTWPEPPLDARVLPGDRAMKSLFESFGWKARLLTMRGA